MLLLQLRCIAGVEQEAGAAHDIMFTRLSVHDGVCDLWLLRRRSRPIYSCGDIFSGTCNACIDIAVSLRRRQTQSLIILVAVGSCFLLGLGTLAVARCCVSLAVLL